MSTYREIAKRVVHSGGRGGGPSRNELGTCHPVLLFMIARKSLDSMRRDETRGRS